MNKKKSAKELLGESLEELLKSKPFDKITVNEIAENCGVGRRTFYNIFIDKYDLATWVYTRQLTALLDNVEGARLGDFIKYSADVVDKDMQIIIALDKYRGQNNFRDSLAVPMTEMYVRVIEKYFNAKVNDEMKADIGFYVGGQIAYVGKVIHSPVIPTAKEVVPFFIRCCPDSLKQFI